METSFLLDYIPPSGPPTSWPHKCDTCGCFVKLATLRGSKDHEGEYWATADCTRCGKRVNANPI